MKKIYAVDTGKVFRDEEGAIASCPDEFRPPYDLYKPKDKDLQMKVQKDLVYVLVVGPGEKEVNKHETEIQLFHCFTNKDFRVHHLSAISSNLEGETLPKITSNLCIPKLGLVKILWRNSPYSLAKTLVALENKITTDGFVYEKRFSGLFTNKADKIVFEPSTEWSEFWTNYGPLFKD
ncbi:MAG: hypothetical protein KBB86_00615 [Candidatus Pacebacteria bacterium]|nr:hypothetical protein [Candidatus Paceibacterota bacterium]